MSDWRERFRASARGEVSREGIDPYRAAGGSVYAYLIDLDEARVQATEPNVQAALLAGWVAFALQVLGDELLDADAAGDPSTAHFLPRVTAEQAMVFYEQVQPWIARSHTAQVSSSYSLDVPLPVALPEWVAAEPCPEAHLVAFRQAAGRLRQQAEAVVAGMDPGPGGARTRELVAGAVAEGSAAFDYAASLGGAVIGRASGSVHEAIEAHLKHAIEVYFYLGQVAAMPALAERPLRQRAAPDGAQRPPSFLETMMRSYPQIANRPRGGMLTGALGGFLGGMLGGALIDEMLGGGFDGGGFDGGGFDGGGFDGGGFDGGGFGNDGGFF